MKPMLVLVMLVTLAACNILNDYGNAACGQNPSWCAATGGAPTGMAACVIGGATLWECNVVPGSAASLPDPGIPHEHPGMCGSFYCASSQEDAENQSGAAGDPRVACAPIVSYVVMAPPWTSCFAANENADAGQPPCAELFVPCSVTAPASGSLACCDTTIYEPSAKLACDVIVGVTQSGICRIEEGYPCSDSSQCLSADIDFICRMGVCCQDQGEECFLGASHDNPVSNNNGCCLDTECLPDTIGNGFSCR